MRTDAVCGGYIFQHWYNLANTPSDEENGLSSYVCSKGLLVAGKTGSATRLSHVVVSSRERVTSPACIVFDPLLCLNYFLLNFLY